MRLILERRIPNTIIDSLGIMRQGGCILYNCIEYRTQNALLRFAELNGGLIIVCSTVRRLSYLLPVVVDGNICVMANFGRAGEDAGWLSY